MRPLVPPTEEEEKKPEPSLIAQQTGPHINHVETIYKNKRTGKGTTGRSTQDKQQTRNTGSNSSGGGSTIFATT